MENGKTWPMAETILSYLLAELESSNRKRPADLAFLGRFAREMVCPLTGKLRGRHDDGYGSSRS